MVFSGEEEMRDKHRHDLVVIGAGIIGLSCAYHLKIEHPEADILVLDKANHAAFGDTSKSAGAVRNTFTSEVNYLLADTSLDFYQHVQRDLQFSLELEFVGYLWLLTEKQHQAFKGFVKSMTNRGIQFKIWSKDDLCEKIKGLCLDFGFNDKEARALGLENISAGVQGVKCGTIGPKLVAGFYERGLQDLGVKVVYNSEVTSFILEPEEGLKRPKEPRIWQDKSIKGVRTKKGDVYAQTTVVSVGRWANELLDKVGIDSHMKTKKRQIFQLSSPEIHDLLYTKGFNEYERLPFTILPKGGVYLRPVRSENGFWTGAADDLGRAFAFEEDPRPEADYFTYNIYPILSKYFSQFKDAKPNKMWAGEYDINTVDANPYIFEESGLLIVAGLSGSGIMKADAVGRIASALHDGKEHAMLYGNRRIEVHRLGVSERNVDPERFVL
jgi:FAD-dependent oxidoreductase domain-containing protein 1